MKKIFLVLLIYILPYNFYASDSFFLQRNINVGCVKSDESFIYVDFYYINNTGRNVVINKVAKSCGCLMVDYTHKPIKKNEKGKIRIKVDLKYEVGNFNKSILVYISGLEPILLKIKGRIY